MTDPTGSAPERLDSWKDIAAYLKRDVSTVQRWEKREGMPVHRHLHDKLGSVYAYPAELDAWARSRRPGRPEVLAEAGETPTKPPRRSRWVAGGFVLVAVMAAVVWTLKPARDFWQNPLANAKFVRLTDFEGIEQAAAISRDGRFVAFISDRDGPVDVWVTQVGTGRFHNLTGGKVRELVNPDIRPIGISPDGALITFWTRRQTASGSPDISVWAVPALGGEPRLYLEGVAEFAWSNDARRLVYHTPAPGDPMFVKDEKGERKIFTAPVGIHNHHQVWSPDDTFIYFVSGPVATEQDVWRINANGGAAQRLTSHNTRVSHLTFVDRRTLLYLATDADGGGPWLYTLDPDRRESRRVSVGVERYTSVAASADARRLVVTVAYPRRTLWRVPIGEGVAEETAATRVTVPIVGGRAPRVGAGYLLYVSSRADGESIWKVAGETASELWSMAGARVIGGPAISLDGRRIAFTAEDRARTRMYVMNSDGSGLRMMTESLQPRGTPAWAPDGAAVAVAAMIGGAQRLVRVSVSEQTITPVGSEFAADPVWSPDGSTLVYSGAEVGTTFPIRAIDAEGQIKSEPKITLSRGIRRLAFLPGQNVLVVLRGEMIHKNFWAIDLDSGRERRLTNFGTNFVTGDFDVSPDGREIVFDREQDNSDIVLIER